MEYYLENMDGGKIWKPGITVHGETLESAVANTYPGATILTIYDRLIIGNKHYRAYEMPGKASDRKDLCLIVSIPRLEIDV